MVVFDVTLILNSQLYQFSIILIFAILNNHIQWENNQSTLIIRILDRCVNG